MNLSYLPGKSYKVVTRCGQESEKEKSARESKVTSRDSGLELSWTKKSMRGWGKYDSFHFRYVNSKVPVRFLVGSYTNNSGLKRTNLQRWRFSTYQLRDEIIEAMTTDEIVPWRMCTSRAAEPGRATPTLKHNNYSKNPRIYNWS